jgi:TRAP transporter TAXI family solute receptor
MPLRIGTSELGGTFYSQAMALAELFNRDRPEADKCVVEPTDASIDNANRLDKGEIDLGFMASNWIGRARDGTPPFTRKIDLRMVSPANAGPIFFVAPAGSPINAVADFRNRRIAVGPSGSGMVQHARLIFNALGIGFDSFTPVYLGFAEGAEALIAGEIDAQFHPPIPNRVIDDLSNRADIRVVPYAPGQLEKILSQVPFYRKITIEKGAFRGVEQEVPQIAVVNVVVTHEKVSEEAVHDLARTIAGNLHKLPKMNPLFQGLSDLFEPLRPHGAAAFEFGGVPLHPGAQRAYREAGWIK